MKKILKRSAVKLFHNLGYSITSVKGRYHDIAVELDDIEVEIIKHVLESGYTTTSVPRLVNTLKSCRYAVENDIPGDFVECGVWRGGHGILAKKILEHLGSNKKVWMFDTFEGMTTPTSFDVEAASQSEAKKQFESSQRETHNDWCYASLEDVKKNCTDSGLNIEAFEFIKGDVCKTLKVSKKLPKEVCVLRLDTDWYASTKVELEVLYPRLSKSGVIIIDDYGHWEGARKAVDEYFHSTLSKPLFNVIDYTGRSAIKL